MRFTPLHINTEYSFQESTIRIDDLIQEAVRNNLTSLVITDHNSMFGVAEFVNKTKKAGIKPVVGLDLDVDDFRLILLAKNFDGYKLLNRLSSKKMRGNAIKLSEIISNDLFVVDHPTMGHFATKGTQLEIGNYFIGTDSAKFANSVYVQEGRILTEDQRETLSLLTSMVGNEFNASSIEPLNFNPSVDKVLLEQASIIVEKCNIIWPESKAPVPHFKNDKGISSIKYLKQVIQEAAIPILKEVDDVKKYADRIKYEVSIIEKLGFEDYFLIIWDMIKWAKENGISIGPGRGSAAGSIVSYILNITEVDPLEYGLLFERFLNPERVTMPDIDIDIQDNKREEVVQYLFDRYGSDNVALISTFSKLGAKSSIRDVARFLNIPSRDVNTISKLIPADSNLKDAYKSVSKFRALIDSSEEYSKLFRLASTIEGLPRQHSTHAAGIVLSDNAITDKAPTIEGPDGHNQVQYSMDYLEENNLLKIDLLGLRNLTIIKRIQEEIYENHGKRVNLHKIPLNDEETNKILSQGDTNGIFQLESYGMKKTLEEVGVSSLDDIVAILSLYRPGPMDNIPLYADIKSGKKPLISVSPEYDRITKNTYGIIVYQEQIMQIAQEFSGMSFGQADILRRAIGKKKAKLIDSLKKVFIEGAISKGQSRESVEKIYSLIEKFADYGFNKSHAVAYSILSYRMGYLKARFKFEFYTALLEASISSQSTVQKYVEEAKRREIKVLSPEINSSSFKVINKDGKIILPFQVIKGFGDAAATKLLDERANGDFKDFFDFITRAKMVGIGDSGIQILIESNTLRSFGNTQALLDTLPSALRYANMITFKEGDVTKIDESIISKPKMIKSQRDISAEIFNEKKLLGFQMNAFITGEYEKETKLLDIKENEAQEVVFLVERIRKYKANNGTEYARITISDSSSTVDLVAFSNVLKFIEHTKDRTIVQGLVECKVRDKKRSYTLKNYWKEIKNG